VRSGGLELEGPLRFVPHLFRQQAIDNKAFHDQLLRTPDAVEMEGEGCHMPGAQKVVDCGKSYLRLG